MRPKITLFIVIAWVTSVVVSCEKPLPKAPNTPIFDAALFKQNLKSKLFQKAADDIGYAFIINHHGLLVESAQVGYARMPQDGERKWSITKEMNIASLTKWLTAVGAMRLLKERNISLDDSIWHWLPNSWVKGAGVKNISFRELLTHKTGLTTDSIRYGTDYQSLKDCIKTGIVNNTKSYNYSNVNFALFRIMFAYINDEEYAEAIEHLTLTINEDTTSFHAYLVTAYTILMQEKVFTPAGVSNAVMYAEDYNPDNITLMYYRFNPSQNGSSPGLNWSLIGGGGGYYLSPKEVASVMAHVLHSEDILSSSQVTEMKNDKLGFDSKPMTDRGRSYEKGGALYNDKNNDSDFSYGDNGLEAKIMAFPDEVELVLFVNSIANGWTNHVPAIIDAYNDAWVME